MESRPNLLGMTPVQISDAVAPLVDRPFRASQVAQWVHRRHATSFQEMSNLPKALRKDLDGRFALAEPHVEEVRVSVDGSRKYLLRLDDDAIIEGVAMAEERKATYCLSSQTGCAVGCVFCVTGVLGSGRNLRAEEMVGQYRLMSRDLDPNVERANIVFMGMGEPLLNTSNLGTALEVLYERVSPRRITVSTAGIVPGIKWLGGLPKRPKLAVSLNAPSQEIRERIMPISRTYPLPRLFDELRRFPLERGRRITFEYVLIRGVNDRVDDASAVAALVRGIPSKINLIPFNEDPDHLPGLTQPDHERVNAFARVIRDAGLTVTVRWSRGRDVAAACGQLKGQAR